MSSHPTWPPAAASPAQVPGVGLGEVAIRAEGLSRVYRVQKKPPGLLGSLRGLVRREYTEVRAVDALDIEIRRGELIGFLGPNGAGKTTALKMMAGLLEPSAGQVRVLGYEPFKRERAFQRRFALVLGQKNQLWWDLPASESFLLTREIYGISDADYRRTLGELVDLLELAAVLDVQVRKLSLGERMKCELAAALLHRPDVLFLDEPTIGLDVVMQRKIREFIAAYRERHQATILLTSHYMDDVKALCERVVVIDHGRLIYDGALRELTRRYADVRLLTLDLDAPVTREALAAHGEVVSWEPEKVALRIPREQVSATAARLLATLQVRDLAIAEPDVEDVIRDLFSGQLRADADRPPGASDQPSAIGEQQSGVSCQPTEERRHPDDLPSSGLPEARPADPTDLPVSLGREMMSAQPIVASRSEAGGEGCSPGAGGEGRLPAGGEGPPSGGAAL